MQSQPAGTAATASVNALLDAFPPHLCDCTASPEALSMHMQDARMRQAPIRARSAALALRAAVDNGHVHDMSGGLGALQQGLRQRVARSDVALFLAPAQLELLRMLFVCTTLMLDAVFCAAAPPELAAQHAEAALTDLALIALGSVAVPRLAALENILLTHVAAVDRLQPVLLGLLDMEALPESPRGGAAPAPTACESTRARHALALHWATCALSTPGLAPRVWQSLPQLIDASTSLRGDPSLTACAGIVHAALGGLAVDIGTEHAVAASVIECVGARCDAFVADGDERAVELSALLFSLMPLVKEPMMPPLMLAASAVVRRAASAPLADEGGKESLTARCCANLRDAVSMTPAGERKRALVTWLFDLRRALPPPPAASLSAGHSGAGADAQMA